MSSPVQMAQQPKIGGCPHGLPPGACPICSGGGAGGAKKADFSAKPGEMSWAECAAVGQMLKAQQMANKRNEQAFLGHQQMAVVFQKNVAALAQKLADFVQTIQTKTPALISKPTSFIINKIAIPILNAIKNLPLNIQTKIAEFGQKIADISDKLAAVFGEMKNTLSDIKEKISNRLKEIKKKFTSLFSIFEANYIDDEEKKIEESKRLFNIKTTLQKIRENLLKGKTNDKD